MEASCSEALTKDRIAVDDLTKDALAPDGAAGEIFDREYYATHCGSLPYDPSCGFWASFFGRIADELVRSFRPRRVFDAGCAHGFLVEAFRDRGVEAWGRDISRFANSHVRPDLRQYCAMGSIADPIEGRYDLITCIEVLEHMPEADAIQAIAAMARVTDRILFSSSPGDFDEPTHINVRPAIYWLRLFAAQGFGPDMGYDATFILPHALMLERADVAPGERDLNACAELVRIRLLLAGRERANRELEAERDRLNRELEAERARVNHELEVQVAHANSSEAQLIQAICDLETERVRKEAKYQSVAAFTMWVGAVCLRSMGTWVPPRMRRGLRGTLGFVRRGAAFPWRVMQGRRS
jgi:SAM-dependent methyltransferase